jgi:hypothetical protein
MTTLLKAAVDWCAANTAQVRWLTKSVELTVWDVHPHRLTVARFYFASTLDECVDQALVDFPAEAPSATGTR